MDIKLTIEVEIAEANAIGPVSLQHLFECWVFDQLGCSIEVTDPNTGEVIGDFVLDEHAGFTVKLMNPVPDPSVCQDPNHSKGPFCSCRFKNGWR